ncbi:MAG TPA: hypothetical protein VN520_30510 [Streptomyces sp.]|uniref:hypothetical protein n=1 Tax=Streptomyces sp. TaxID=1931 RepID=UPI002C44BC78|nr:hypothetical protein [Streptomyces sp.]HWU10644.1 hypothetical protein [Streptomyces sp.]
MSIFDDIAAIVHPMPEPGDVPEDVFNDVCHDVDAARKELAFNLEMAWDADSDNEPLLSAIGAARYRKEQAEAEIRRLVAYGREFTRPRPYKLADLAAASGMSVSGVRTAYGHGDVAAVEQGIGRKPREWRATSPDDPPEAGSEA